VDKTNGKGKKLGHDKGKGQSKKQNGKAPSNGKGAKQFQDGNHPGQGLEHRSDRANEVAQNVNKNPNLQYLLDDPNSPYYQGGTPGQTDPDAPIQNEDGTIHDAQIIVIGPTDDQLYFFHPDHLGSTSYVTDEEGDIHEHVEYFPFGETWYQEGGNNKVTPYLFTSKELDSETGYYYFGARYYDPRVSTWISPDPAFSKYFPNSNKSTKFNVPRLENDWQASYNLPGLGGVLNTANNNVYAYTGNNPIRYTDPDGNFLVTAVIAGVLDVATQAAEMQLGLRDEFSVGSVVTSTVAGAVGAGLVNQIKKTATLAKMAKSKQMAMEISTEAAVSIGAEATKNAVRLDSQEAKSGSELFDNVAKDVIGTNIMAKPLDNVIDNTKFSGGKIGTITSGVISTGISIKNQLSIDQDQ